MENRKIFKNRFTLSYLEPNVQEEFDKYSNRKLFKYNKWMILFSLALSTGDVIFHELIKGSQALEGLEWVQCTRILSYILFGIFTICAGVVIFTRKLILHKIANHFNFLFTGISLYHWRTYFFGMGMIEQNIYGLLLSSELLIRVVMIYFLLVIIPEAYIMTILFIICKITYLSVLFGPNKIVNHAYTVLEILFICYFYTKQVKINFNSMAILRNKNNWYKNLLEYLNCGFFSVKDDLFKCMNHTLFEILNKNKKFSNFLNNPDNGENVLLDVEHNFDAFQRNKFISMKPISDGLINTFLENITHPQLQFSNPSEILKYIDSNPTNKFSFLGFKDLEIDNEQINNSISRSTNFEFGDKITLEIFYRYYYSGQKKEIEFVVNDITSIKSFEKTNAELKYKTQFLSKIAHEFKNPLICISELGDQMKEKFVLYSQSKENKNSSEKSSDNEINFNNSNRAVQDVVHIISNIKSFSNYLIMQIKNLDYFCYTEAKEQPPLEVHQIDLQEVIDFIQRIGEILLVKYNKKVKFEITHNFKFPALIKTDETKLKQILINLISNSIKFIHSGKIEFQIKFNSVKRELEFVIKDSGPGLSEQRISEIYKQRPFQKMMTLENNLGSGLGLSIVQDILKQFNSALEIDSKEGEGSTFLFRLHLGLDDHFEESENVEFELKHISLGEQIEKSEDIFSKKTIIVDNLKPLEIRSHIHNLNYKEQILNYDKNTEYYIVTDDEKIIRNNTIRCINRVAKSLNKKIEIIEGEDGIECLYLVYKYIRNGFKISGIISDELMTYMTGSEAANVLKSLDKLNSHQIPYILLSAFPKSSNLSIDGFITKPLDEKGAEWILNLSE